MREVRPVDLYFDFVSPYSYLALTQVEAFAQRHGVRWGLQPVVYGALLDAHGLVGPAEVSAKRRYTFRDIARSASLLGIELVGPPAHPFRSLEALRCVCLFIDRPEALRLTVALSRACWGRGEDLTDAAVLAEVVARAGLPAADLDARIADPTVKRALRDRTEAALAAGIFGVPTFRYRDEIFWGHDRLSHLAARLSGELPDVEERAAQMEKRPRAADRAAAPLGRRRPGAE